MLSSLLPSQGAETCRRCLGGAGAVQHCTCSFGGGSQRDVWHAAYMHSRAGPAQHGNGSFILPVQHRQTQRMMATACAAAQRRRAAAAMEAALGCAPVCHCPGGHLVVALPPALLAAHGAMLGHPHSAAAMRGSRPPSILSSTCCAAAPPPLVLHGCTCRRRSPSAGNSSQVTWQAGCVYVTRMAGNLQ